MCSYSCRTFLCSTATVSEMEMCCSVEHLLLCSFPGTHGCSSAWGSPGP